MRKMLIGVLIVILIVGIIFTLGSGISLGKIQISSMQQLSEKDQKIETDMKNLKQMKEVTFPEAMDTLNQSAKDLQEKREEYASLVNESTEGELNSVVTAEKYEVEYLWVKLGNHATKNGVTLKLNILNATTGLEGTYDLEFTLNGKYSGITEFIYEIENDSTLGFRIDGFSLVPTTTQNKTSSNNQTQTNDTADTENLTATFTVKEVAIDISSESENNNATGAGQDSLQQENTTTNTTNP